MQREDSTFVHVALLDLYRNNISALKEKTLSGHSKQGDKTFITPEKRNALESLFIERLSYIPETTEERKQNLNKLIRNTIDNESRKK